MKIVKHAELNGMHNFAMYNKTCFCGNNLNSFWDAISNYLHKHTENFHFPSMIQLKNLNTYASLIMCSFENVLYSKQVFRL